MENAQVMQPLVKQAAAVFTLASDRPACVCACASWAWGCFPLLNRKDNIFVYVTNVLLKLQARDVRPGQLVLARAGLQADLTRLLRRRGLATRRAHPAETFLEA